MIYNVSSSRFCSLFHSDCWILDVVGAPLLPMQLKTMDAMRLVSLWPKIKLNSVLRGLPKMEQVFFPLPYDNLNHLPHVDSIRQGPYFMLRLSRYSHRYQVQQDCQSRDGRGGLLSC
jgi:hypothetical protein